MTFVTLAMGSWSSALLSNSTRPVDASMSRQDLCGREVEKVAAGTASRYQYSSKAKEKG